MFDAAAEERALLILLHERGMSHAKVRTSITEKLSPSEILASVRGVQLDFFDASDVDERLKEWRSRGIWVTNVTADDYPRQLRGVHDHPLFLFGLGAQADDARSVAIVGSREPVTGALQYAHDVAAELGRRGLTVVSGLAKGIDAAAHAAALSVGARTVAIVGTGVDRIYPRENQGLYKEILQEGQILSQFWPGSSPTRASFPMRNVTMSGYSGATLIVTASEKSGTKHQAYAAVNHGRPLFLTHQVAEGTSWGRDYVERGVAHVVGTILEAADSIENAASNDYLAEVWGSASR
ncbi:DNA-processing protein DprA [Agrococcus casei]|uniref:DNA-processing protein DprA n=1 Tax=Agrococcus casei TaxID=343512 RepID=UPI000B359566|nr:DNA-processing protein DprA [Agrococcus casei]